MAKKEEEVFIKKSPKAFKRFKNAHNALVKLLLAMQGYGGIEVKATKGKIIISTRQSMLNGGSAATNELHYNDGSVQIDIDGWGVKVANLSAGNGDYVGLNWNGWFMAYNGAANKTLTLKASDVTHDMGIKEIDVCDAGVAKKMLVLASAPY